MTAWQVSELCFTHILSTLDCRVSNYQGNHSESRIRWKSFWNWLSVGAKWKRDCLSHFQSISGWFPRVVTAQIRQTNRKPLMKSLKTRRFDCSGIYQQRKCFPIDDHFLWKYSPVELSGNDDSSRHLIMFPLCSTSHDAAIDAHISWINNTWIKTNQVLSTDSLHKKIAK